MIEKLANTIRTAEWYVGLQKKWKFTKIPILSYEWPKVPMLFADIISETLARPTIKSLDMVNIAGYYGLVGSDTHLLPSLVFEARVLEQVGPNAGELTEFRISSPFLDQLKEQGVLVERVPTMVPQVGEVSIAPKILISIMPKFVRKIFAGTNIRVLRLPRRRLSENTTW